MVFPLFPLLICYWPAVVLHEQWLLAMVSQGFYFEEFGEIRIALQSVDLISLQVDKDLHRTVQPSRLDGAYAPQMGIRYYDEFNSAG